MRRPDERNPYATSPLRPTRVHAERRIIPSTDSGKMKRAHVARTRRHPRRRRRSSRCRRRPCRTDVPHPPPDGGTTATGHPTLRRSDKKRCPWLRRSDKKRRPRLRGANGLAVLGAGRPNGRTSDTPLGSRRAARAGRRSPRRSTRLHHRPPGRLSTWPRSIRAASPAAPKSPPREAGCQGKRPGSIRGCDGRAGPVPRHITRVSGNLVRTYPSVSSGESFTVPGPLRTKKSPPSSAVTPFHVRNTGSGLRRQLTTQTLLPSTI